MGIQGTGLSEKNVRLRFFGIIFMGIIAFAAILYWRSATITNSEYVQFDIPRSDREKPKDGTLRSKKYELDIEETNASIN